MKSNWPDETPSPDERRRSPIGLIVVLGIAAGAYLYFRDHTPNIDLRGMLPAPSATEQTAEPPAASVAETPANPFQFPEATPADDSTTTHQAVPFDSCLSTIAQMQNALSAKPEVLVDEPERRSIRFSMDGGSVTITCSGRDQTMTIAREEGGQR